ITKTFDMDDNGQKVRVTYPDGVPRFSADGYGPSLFGFPMTTLSLFQTQISAADSPTVQERKIVAEIQIPTVTLIELVNQIQAALNANAPAVDAALTRMKQI